MKKKPPRQGKAPHAQPTTDELAELDRLLAMANTKLPAAYSCIAQKVGTPEDGAMLALLVARRFCDMRIDPPLNLKLLCACVDQLTYVDDKPGGN